MERMKAQASVEYLIVLAIAIVLAIVVLAVLGFFPNFSSNIDHRAAENFWRTQARPFSAVDAYFNVQNRLTYIALENNDDETFILKSVYLNGQQAAYNVYNESGTDFKGISACGKDTCAAQDCDCNFTYSARQMRRIVVEPVMTGDEVCGIGGTQGRIPIRFTYARPEPYNGSFTQIGAMPLAVWCKRP